MEFLKKHYEKIALAIVSLMLIATALTLVNKLGFGGSEHPDIDRAHARPLGTNDLTQMQTVLKKSLGTNDLVWIATLLENPRIDTDLLAKPLDTNEMTQIATLLKTPPSWRTNDGPRPFIPEAWNWDGKDLFPAGEPPKQPTDIIRDPADELDWWVASRTFPVKFMAVTSGAGTSAVFQINIAGTGSRFVKVGDPPIRQTIYGTMEEFSVLRYEEKKPEWFNPKIGAKQVLDVSELVLQRKSAGIAKEILLVVGKQAMESDPVARYQSSATSEWSVDLKKGSKFAYKGKTYELVRLDISLTHLIFKDVQTQKEYRKRFRVVQRF